MNLNLPEPVKVIDKIIETNFSTYVTSMDLGLTGRYRIVVYRLRDDKLNDFFPHTDLNANLESEFAFDPLADDPSPASGSPS